MGKAATKYTIRRWSDHFVGWLSVVLAASFELIGLVSPDPGTTFGQQVTVELLFSIASAVWLLSGHPKVVLGDRDVLVVNWFWKYRVPWEQVAGVEGDGGTILCLRDGREIKMSVGAPSLASALNGNVLQRGIADRIATAREEAVTVVEGEPVESGLDLHIGRFLLWHVVFIGIGWLAIHQ